MTIQLAKHLTVEGRYIRLRTSKTYISNKEQSLSYISMFNTIRGLLIYGLKNNLFNSLEIKSWFGYETDEDRKKFESLIDGLDIYLLKQS
jgi:hypothetical protein